MTSCRGCGASGAEPVIDLGRQPLANAYLDEPALDRPEATYPLALVFCPRCSLVQISESVDPQLLFGDYRYLSSSSDAFVERARALATRLVDRYRLNASSQVYEIGSNDGYLLQHYRDLGIPVRGVEPAKAIARVATGRGVPTLSEFFSSAVARALRSDVGPADVIHANNVLAHVPDVHDVLRGIEILLADDGTLVVETPYVRNLVDGLEFDTIYHEHVYYYSLTSLAALWSASGLRIVDVERLPVHGGSLRVFGRKASSGGAQGPEVGALLADEVSAGIVGHAYYRSFAARVDALGVGLREMLVGLRKDGRRIAAYGAAAKGTVLLNAFGIGADLIDFVVDRNPMKQGLYMPGQHLPIRPVEDLLTEVPDVVLLLAWNVADEVVGQQEAYLRHGGRFLVPVPEPHFVG